ncbi:hypothetical protein BS17DRAFT_54079 [Gyrodon lividus]|nr:hypothetical protein BS17DRAFT_54079 [Gyrodon lividus]
MGQPSPVCLSLAPNLRCVSFTQLEHQVLIIPPAIEVIVCIFFILLKRRTDRAHILLLTDGILYYIWALLDMLSHVVPAARNSLSIFKALDICLGSVSFTPLLLYSLYLYQLAFHELIPDLPRRLQAFPQIFLPTLLVVVVAINEVASFVGTTIGSLSPNQAPVINFTHNNESLWLSLSQFSLALYTIIQILFFLLAFYRLANAFLDQRRIELAHSDECHFFHGIAWITAGIELGVIEALSGFAQGSFAVAFARRILRLIARTVLMVGLLKGLDVAENLNDELSGVSRISKRISHILGANPRLVRFQRAPQLCPYPSREHELSPVAKQEKQHSQQRVIIHYEKGQAPFLQIRFSALDVPTQAVLADTVQSGRRSVSWLIPGHAGADGSSQQHNEANLSTDVLARNALLEAPRAKPALPAPGGSGAPAHLTGRDGQPGRAHVRQESGGAISDNVSIVRDLERSFPNLPPRITGKYRGSILGQGYEEDPFPVVGISRESSVRRNGSAQNTNEGAVASVGLSANGSIKRKPAPPLLENLAYISGRNNRSLSTWGGLTQNTVKYPAVSPATPTSSWTDMTAYGPQTVSGGGSGTRMSSRRMSASDLFRRASKAMSDASIREWLASARSPRLVQSPLTPVAIEMYRSGVLGPSSPRRMSENLNTALMSANNLLPETNRRFVDDANAIFNVSPRRQHIITVSVARAPMQIAPGAIHVE